MCRLPGHDEFECKMFFLELIKPITEEVSSKDEKELKDSKIHVESSILRKENVLKSVILL